MRIHHHTAFSLAASGLLYLTFKSWGMSISCFIAGVFIDLDHIPDYLREHGWPFKVQRFFDICNKSQFDRILLLWHGWEWVALFTAASWLTEWNPWITGSAIGIASHILLDQFYNGVKILSYSLIWRWHQGFEFDSIFPELKEAKYRYAKDFKPLNPNNTDTEKQFN